MTEEYSQDQRIYFHIKKKQKNTKILIQKDAYVPCIIYSKKDMKAI